MEYPSQQILVNGIDMHAAIVGEGSDVLTVHGYPDTRGCGDAGISKKRRSYQIDNLVADLVALLDVLEIESVRLVGHDWGSAICWQLAIDHPEHVERYVALSTGHPKAYRRGCGCQGAGARCVEQR